MTSSFLNLALAFGAINTNHQLIDKDSMFHRWIEEACENLSDKDAKRFRWAAAFALFLGGGAIGFIELVTRLMSRAYTNVPSSIENAIERLSDRILTEAQSAENIVEQADDALAKTKIETSISHENVGGGWYEVSVSGVVVEKVQGKEAADNAVMRYKEQALQAV